MSPQKHGIRYRHKKQCSILVIIKEMQMCTTIEYFETIIKIALKIIENIKCIKDTEQLKLSHFAVWMPNYTSSLKNN